ncbi:MAG: GNAT family N-acetyltransferase [Gammaproteobacteria bacterium]|nr:GNAT family N-acetyltransferase [Gammaproteobacteria bacterium]
MTMLPDASLPTIEATRLILRELIPEDAPALFAIFGDPEVCRYWSRPPMDDLRAARALQAEIAACFTERTLFQWGLAERESGNTRSIRVLERLGFVWEGYLRERYHLHGETQDAVLFGLLHREWAPHQGS